VTKLRVVEIYASYQGEGPNTSRPTVFVRFAGCNFKCPGWPCDTQHAIQPAQFTKLQRHYEPIALADHVLSFEVDNICLTGGEVFLQNKSALRVFINALKVTRDDINVEVFTNGSLDWGPDIPLMVDNFILDWKLPGSGEEYDPTTAFEKNFRDLNQLDAVKFTIKNEEDFHEAIRRYREHIEPIPFNERPLVYAGVVWGQELDTATLCQWMLNQDLDWRLNVQVHKFVWHPDKIGV
jgi:7-carboxy-7-deazaguanine synthase